MNVKKNFPEDTIEILIVEDSPTQAEQLKYILEKQGYKVPVANNGKQALSLFGKHKPALVISDIIMPEMDGYELCKQIKLKSGAEEVPVILLTSLSNAEDVLEGLACGADKFITKPYSEDYLFSSIKQTLANRKLHKGERERISVEILFAGKKRLITAEQRQMLTLLLSTYEAAVLKNKELAQSQENLRSLNENLDNLVKERTAALSAEIEVRKRTEQEVLRLNKELLQKNTELEQIVYVTSHDLRTPLVNVQGFSKELGYSADDLIGSLNTDDFPKDIKKKIKPILEKDIPESLKFIQGSISQMDRLLSGLLRLSRLGRAALNMGNLDMNKILEETSQGHEFKLKETGTKLVIKKLPPCTGDKIQIDQLFSNLINNALKYLDPGRSGVIKISGKKEKEQSVYCVEDNGIGIAPDYHKKIFEIFHRLNPKEGKGEGLGLTIVRRILDRHNGKIWVESEVGKGSRFYVQLPC